MCIFGRKIINYYFFLAFKDNLLAQNQSDSVHISFSIFCLAVMGFCDALLMVVSSANKIDLE